MMRTGILCVALLSLVACGESRPPAVVYQPPPGEAAPPPGEAAPPPGEAAPPPGATAPGPGVQPAPGTGPQQPPPAADANYACQAAADCAIKNVGNCCGYFPACVNKDAVITPAKCPPGVAGVCGFPHIEACQCLSGRCQAAP